MPKMSFLGTLDIDLFWWGSFVICYLFVCYHHLLRGENKVNQPKLGYSWDRLGCVGVWQFLFISFSLWLLSHGMKHWNINKKWWSGIFIFIKYRLMGMKWKVAELLMIFQCLDIFVAICLYEVRDWLRINCHRELNSSWSGNTL